MKVLMLFLQDRLSNMHLHKDPVSIPRSFSKIGWESHLVAVEVDPCINCSKLNNLYLYNLNFTKLSLGRSIINPLEQAVITLRSVSMLAKLINIVLSIHPDLLISYNNFMLTPILMGLIRIMSRDSFLIVKLDSDGVIRGTKLGRFLQKMNLLLEGLVAHLLAIESPLARDRIVASIPSLKKKIIVVPNGIDDMFVSESSSRVKRQKSILCVSRVIREKGLDVLLHAYAFVHRSHPDWILFIVGPMPDPQYYSYLIRLRSKLGLSECVKFEGEKHDYELLDYYRTSSIFCLPSRYEGFGISILEAMAMGLPVITTKATPIDNYLKNSAIMVEVEDIEGLANAISLLIEDAQKRASLAERGRVLAGGMTWDKIVRKLLEKTPYRLRKDT